MKFLPNGDMIKLLIVTYLITLVILIFQGDRERVADMRNLLLLFTNTTESKP